MSNTSTVTPYDDTPSQASSTTSTIAGAATETASAAIAVTAAVVAGVASCAIATGAAAVAVARWIGEETDSDREVKARHKEARRLSSAQTSRVEAELALRSTRLHLREATPLLEAARALGYLPVADSPAQFPANSGITLLEGRHGERLAVEQNANGRLVVHSAGDAVGVRALLREHTLSQARRHLEARGMAVQVAVARNGEVQILAREASPGRGGQAEVRAQVRADGTAWVDVDKIRGNRCAEIVQGLADAVGGVVAGEQRKDAFFQLPGEPAMVRLKE